MKKLLPGCLIAIVMGASLVACDNNDKSSADDAANKDSMDMKMDNGMADNSMTYDHAMATVTGTMPDTTVEGTVKFDKAGDNVKMMLELTIPKMANKSVAVHLHETGECGDMGKHAMGHWNPTNEAHGKWGTHPFHSGDIGNVSLDGNGKGKMDLETELWSIGGNASKNILNRALIVHSGVDDYTSQPSGDAGSRIGCAVIKEMN